MKIITQIILITMILGITICGCRKPKYKACFTADKTTANVGDTLTFTDCSDYDGNVTLALWSFGDGARINSNGGESVKHAYNTIGEYEVMLLIGEKENSSEQSKIIKIQ
jgi:PKD repeat protein